MEHETVTLAAQLKALADPNRLFIFSILMTGVHCNCELAEKTGLAVNLISHHLRILSEADLVCSERDDQDGRWKYYTVNHQAVIELKQMLDQVLDLNQFVDRTPICGPKKMRCMDE
ncbi:MAG: winged helix-turn-helix transcriptional regulator [Anaerolineaceae bacterium]|nr:winged helix-turn-helix transcriptional regulator [Anaerolineaceae bacterium]